MLTDRASYVARLAALALSLALAGCGSLPFGGGGGSQPDSARESDTVPAEAPETPTGAAADTAADTPQASSGDSAATASAGSAAMAKALPAAPSAAAKATTIDVPPRAAADFARAVTLMRGGDVKQATLEFDLMTQAYPSLPGPYINLGILHRKAGKLPEAERAARTATERAPQNAQAWTELGVILRQSGKFADAKTAYEQAIAADANYAAAHRNLGVLLDLYIGDPAGAQAAFESYKTITGEEQPVSGWIAELKQRQARAAAPKPEGGQ